MRTFRFTYNNRIDADTNYSISTEVVIGEEDDPEEVGAETWAAVKSFIIGIGRDHEEDKR